MKKIFLIILFLVFFNGNAQAREARSITISPPTINLDLSPGESSSGVLQVRNNGTGSLNFNIGIFDYIVNDTKGTPIILTSPNLSIKFSAASWISTDSEFFTLTSHTTQKINYKISVPTNARPGGHYASVIYKSDSVNSDQTNAKVVAQLGTLFYINVKGIIQESAEVIKFEAKKFQEYGPIDLEYRVKNLGDLHIRPKGSIVIVDTFGHEIERQEIPEHNIFPEASYDYKTTLGEKFMIGRYTVKLVANYGENNNRPLMKSVEIIVFPWKIAIITTLVLIIVLLGLYIFKRKST